MEDSLDEQAAPAESVRWTLFLWPPLAFSFLLFALPQVFFIWMSFHKNLGFGRISQAFTFENYIRVLTDPLYLSSLGLTFYLSLAVTLLCLCLGFPTAYVLARVRARWASFLVSVLLISSFITVVIKALGLIVILSQNGLVNRLLLALGVVTTPIRMLSNNTGVLVGLIHYTLPLLVILLVGVFQTIPSSLEEAATIHGASRLAVFRRILVPLAMPGLIGGSLMVFNMSMGAFTSAVLLGGGRVLTLPVLIQRKIIFDVDYPLGSTLSTLLLLVVFLLNVFVAALVTRMTPRIRRAVV
jgi:putative spermidine/putrescine transport system permease protein